MDLCNEETLRVGEAAKTGNTEPEEGTTGSTAQEVSHLSRAARTLQDGFRETWDFLAPKLLGSATVVGAVVAIWKFKGAYDEANDGLKNADRMMTFVMLLLTALPFMGVSTWIAVAAIIIVSGIYWWYCRRCEALVRECKKELLKDLGKVLGVRLGLEGLKQLVKKLAACGRVEESLAEDLADNVTSDSLVGMYFFLGCFFAENITQAFTSAAKFARMAGALRGPLQWLRCLASRIMGLNWVAPWWAMNHRARTIREWFQGHWVSLNVFGCFPFLFLRRNSRRLAASAFVGMTGMMIWKMLPGRRRSKPEEVTGGVWRPIGPGMPVSSRGAALWRKRANSHLFLEGRDPMVQPWSRTEEGKSLLKGRGKNKGRAQSLRATGSRKRRVMANRAKSRRGAGGAGGTKYNRTVNSELHWYDDDQVQVYDPESQTQHTLTLGSDEFKELYRRVRQGAGHEQAFIFNERTGQQVTLYGDRYGDDGNDDVEDRDYDNEDFNEAYQVDDYEEDYRLQEARAHPEIYSSQSLELAKEKLDAINLGLSYKPKVGKTPDPSNAELVGESSSDCDERVEESTLGRDSIILNKFKGGVASAGENSISTMLISQRLVLMKHFVDRVEGKTFQVKLGGTTYLIDKDEGCALGSGGELMTYPQPKGLVGFKSSKFMVSTPGEVPSGSQVTLVRFGGEGASEVSVGKWHKGSYDACTKPGWCGSAVVVQPPKGRSMVVGVHRWGEGVDGLNMCEPFDSSAIEYFKRTPCHPVTKN